MLSNLNPKPFVLAVAAGLAVSFSGVAAFATHGGAGHVDTGKAVYETTCVACHGANGKGTVPGVPDFNKSKSPLVKADEELFANIKNGFQSPGSLMPMPPRGGNSNLSEADIQAVLNYLKVTFSRSHGGE